MTDGPYDDLKAAKRRALERANETGRLFAVQRHKLGGDFWVEPFKPGETDTRWGWHMACIGPGAHLEG